MQINLQNHRKSKDKMWRKPPLPKLWLRALASGVGTPHQHQQKAHPRARGRGRGAAAPATAGTTAAPAAGKAGPRIPPPRPTRTAAGDCFCHMGRCFQSYRMVPVHPGLTLQPCHSWWPGRPTECNLSRHGPPTPAGASPIGWSEAPLVRE